MSFFCAVRRLLVVAVCLGYVGHEHASTAMFPINFFRPFNYALRPDRWQSEKWQITTYGEFSHRARGVNDDQTFVNPLQIWSATQDGLAMFQGFPENSPITQFFDNVLMMPTDNGIRGHFDVTGDVRLHAGWGYNIKYWLPHDFNVGVYIPFYAMKLSNVVFKDLTPDDMNPENIKVREEFTSKLQEVVHMFDPEYNLDGWDRVGPGDVVFLAEWWGTFPQRRHKILKNVALNLRFGPSFPTGLRTEVNDIFSIPFGFDGTYGLIFGGGIELTWFGLERGIRAGLDFQFIQLFGTNRTKRIKVAQDQTELLLLATEQVFQDPGFTENFNLYLQAYRFYRGFSATFWYQFFRHNEDTLALSNLDFIPSIANSATSLEDWTFHQAIFKLEYDCQWEVEDKSWFKPQISLFYKLPFNGTQSVLLNTAGFILTFNF